MTDPQKPKPPDDAALANVDMEPVVPEGTAAPGTLTIAPPEQLTEEDLEAREHVNFALDLEPMLPGPAVGSERVLLETDPAAAKRLGVRSVWEPGASPSTPEAAPAPSVEEPVRDFPMIDVEPVLGPPPSVESEPQVIATPPARAPMPPVDLAQDSRRTFIPAHGNAVPQGARSWPRAWAWAGLGAAPSFGGRMAQPSKPRPSGESSMAEDLLELAAVGTDEAGVTEMLLIFKEDVLRGLTCKLRVEPGGLFARFMAPDENVRRFVESTAEDLVARMRRRGMRVGGWTVEVAR